MGYLQVAALVVFSATTCLATYGPHHGGDSDGPRKVHIDSPKIHLDSPRIHLDSPKIFLERPRFQYNDGHVLEDEPLIYDSERPIYVRKAQYGVHSSSAGVAPLIINGGYGGYGHHVHAHAASAHGGKVYNVAGPVVVAPSPIVHDGPILVRRPVVVAKELSPSQEHLEGLHYDRHVALSNGYHAHGGVISSGHALSKAALADKALYYDRAAPLHSLGHGLISYSAYQSPVVVGHGHGQPRAIIRSHGGLVEKDIHGSSGYVKKY